MSKLNLPDIQGIVVRGYRMPIVRYFLLKVNTPAAARALIGRMATGDEHDVPQITTADEWHVATQGPHDDPRSSPKRKPDYCLNVGVTWPGLVALGVNDRVPPVPPGPFDAFIEGAAKRAGRVGDHGDSGPEHWVGGFGTGNDHVMMALYASSLEARDAYSDRLMALFQHDTAFEVLWRVDGAAMTEVVNGQPMHVPKTHFGYTDGITTTPRIKGGPEPVSPDHQEPCEPWLFVLSDDADNYHLPSPPALWRNGSFGVFKMIEQDVVGFENFLQSNKDRIDPELLAAKICGRWRNGVPLALSPDTDSPPGGLTRGRNEQLRVCQQRRVGRPPRVCVVPSGRTSVGAIREASRSQARDNRAGATTLTASFAAACRTDRRTIPTFPTTASSGDSWGISSTPTSRTSTSSY